MYIYNSFYKIIQIVSNLPIMKYTLLFSCPHIPWLCELFRLDVKCVQQLQTTYLSFSLYDIQTIFSSFQTLVHFLLLLCGEHIMNHGELKTKTVNCISPLSKLMCYMKCICQFCYNKLEFS